MEKKEDSIHTPGLYKIEANINWSTSEIKIYFAKEVE